MPPASFSTSARRSAASTNSKSKKAIETYFADKNFYHAREEKQELLDKLIERNELSPGESSTREILDPQGKPRWRQARISFLKNRPYHQHVTEYLTLLGDEQVPEILRVRMAEALAWFNLSVRRMKSPMPDANCSPAATVHRNWPKRCSA